MYIYPTFWCYIINLNDFSHIIHVEPLWHLNRETFFEPLGFKSIRGFRYNDDFSFSLDIDFMALEFTCSPCRTLLYSRPFRKWMRRTLVFLYLIFDIIPDVSKFGTHLTGV